MVKKTRGCELHSNILSAVCTNKCGDEKADDQLSFNLRVLVTFAREMRTKKALYKQRGKEEMMHSFTKKENVYNQTYQIA